MLSSHIVPCESDQNSPVIVIETTVGKILIEVNVKQAPVSSASFLEHVDKGIFTSSESSFYRSMRPPNHEWSLIQGGLPYGDYKLSPIIHESTTETGLSHINGAVSLARTSIGSASGGTFFICVGNQSSIFDEQGQVAKFGGDYYLGFAVFAKVIGGMSTVRRIHQMELAPPENLRYPPLILKSYRHSQ